MFCLLLLKFTMKQHIKKDLIFFFDLNANLLTAFICKNNLRINLGSKSKFFKSIGARQKIRYSYKKGVYI